MKAKAPARKSCTPEALHALDAFHREVRIRLEELLSLVGALHMHAPPDESVKVRLREVIAFFNGPVRDHNYEEERYVFPGLRSSGDGQVSAAAETLCEDHAWIEISWLDMEPWLAMAANGFFSDDLPTLRSTAQTFAAVLRDHMDLEESLLYPQLRGHWRALSPQSRSRRD